jgi:tetratricopeptide (TPR) repeat protein
MMSKPGEVTGRHKLNDEQRKERAQLLKAGHDAFDKENYKKALDNYNRAAVLDGSDPEVWYSLGLAYYNLGFNREAWRSYKLAIHTDPDSIEAVWYAAEFLYNIEDYPLAKLLLERYLLMESDQEKIDEARELLREVQHELGGEEPERPLAVPQPATEEEEVEEEDELEGFDVEDDDALAEEEEEDLEDEDDELEYEEQEGEFVAGLELHLTGIESTCAKCATPIPLDAPYCYNCHAPVFYKGK